MTRRINFGRGIGLPTVPAFTDATDQVAGDVITSDPVTVSGDAEMVWPVTVRGDGSPQIDVAGQEWSVNGNIRAGDQIKLRLTSAATALVARTATLYYQGGSQSWSVTTQDVPWQPTGAANLVMWLDADDDTTLTLSGTDVTSWDDKSGQANHATGVTSYEPVYNATGLNGRPALQAFGAQRMTHAGIITSDYSAFYVIREDSISTVGYFHAGNVGTDGDLAFWSSYSSYGWGIYVNPNITAQTSATHNAGPAVVGFMTGTVFEDGSEVTYQEQNATTGANLTTLFARPDQTALNSNAAISEVVIYDRTLTVDERQRVEGYLAHKWGLTANLPSGHPYKSSAP